MEKKNHGRFSRSRFSIKYLETIDASGMVRDELFGCGRCDVHHQEDSGRN
jgi:hypothetical protein